MAGKLRVIRVLGEGGMGVVVLAEHLRLREKVAVKLPRGEVGAGPEGAKRILREAQAAASLRGEHIARVMDAGLLDDGAPYIVMEYAPGPTLASTLANEGPLPKERAVSVILSLCEGLAEAHGKGIVHRDIKPSNLLLTKRTDGTPIVKVLDFGIAKQTATVSTAMTASSSLLGSPQYMSPEQIRDPRSVDARADLWSTGVVLYELLTGRLPFEAYTTAGVLANVLGEEPVRPSAHVPGIPEELERVVMACLGKAPEERPADVAELATMLAPFGDQAQVARVRAILLESSSAAVATVDPTAQLAETLDGGETGGALPWLERRADTAHALEHTAAPLRPAVRGGRWAAGAGLVALIGVGGWLLARSGAPSAPPESSPMPGPAAASVAGPPVQSAAPTLSVSVLPAAPVVPSAAAVAPSAASSSAASAPVPAPLPRPARVVTPPAAPAPAPPAAPAAAGQKEGEFGGRR